MNYGSGAEVNCNFNLLFKRYLVPVEKSRLRIGVRFDTTNVVNIRRTKRGHETVERDLNQKQKQSDILSRQHIQD